MLDDTEMLRIHRQLHVLRGIREGEKLAVSALGEFAIDSPSLFRGVVRRIRRDGVDVTVAALQALAVDVSYICIRLQAGDAVETSNHDYNWSGACDQAATAISCLGKTYSSDGLLKIGDTMQRVSCVLHKCARTFTTKPDDSEGWSELFIAKENDSAPNVVLDSDSGVSSKTENVLAPNVVLDSGISSGTKNVSATSEIENVLATNVVLNSGISSATNVVLDSGISSEIENVLDTNVVADSGISCETETETENVSATNVVLDSGISSETETENVSATNVVLDSGISSGTKNVSATHVVLDSAETQNVSATHFGIRAAAKDSAAHFAKENNDEEKQEASLSFVSPARERRLRKIIQKKSAEEKIPYFKNVIRNAVD